MSAVWLRILKFPGFTPNGCLLSTLVWMSEESTVQNEEVENLIVKGDFKSLAAFLTRWAVPEVAELILRLSKPNQVLVYRTLSRERAADVFAYFQPEDQDTILEALTDSDTRALLASLSPDDRTALFEELPAKVTRRLMQLLSPSDLTEGPSVAGLPAGKCWSSDDAGLYPDSR